MVTTTPIKLKIGDIQFNVLELTGHEAIDQPFSFDITIIITDSTDFVPERFLLHTATLTIGAREIKGIFTSCAENLFDEQNKLAVTFTFEPRLALCKQTKQCRIILNKKITTIISDILQQHGYQRKQLHFTLRKTETNKPYILQPPNESDLNFILRLLANNGILFWCTTKNDQENICFTDDSNLCSMLKKQIKYNPATNIDQPKVLEIEHKSGIEGKELQDRVYIKSNISSLLPGRRAQLEDKNYLIVSVKHNFAQNVETYGNNLPYINHVVLLPETISYTPASIPFPNFADIVQARIESNDEYAQLDNIGRYRVRQLCNETEQPHCLASPPLTRLTPTSGWHTPLQDGAEVLISTLHGDPDRPIIIGTAPNTKTAPPVTTNNRTQNILRSKNGNEILFDDKRDDEKIKLQTHDQLNILELNAKTDHSSITAQTKEGSIVCRAKDKIKLTCSKNQYTNAGKNHYAYGKNSVKLTSKKNIWQQSANNYQISAKRNLLMRATQNITLSSNKLININCQQNCSMTIKSGDGLITSKNDSINIQSANNITIIGDGNGDIEFAQNGAGFKITPDGRIELFGRRISVAATAGVRLIGKINCLDRRPPTPALVRIQQPTKIHPLASLIYKNSSLHLINNTVKIQLHFDCKKQQAAENNFLDGMQYVVTAQREFRGEIKDSTIAINNVDLEQPLEFTIEDQKQHQLLYIIGINGKTLHPKPKIKISKKDLKQKQHNIYYLSITTIPPPIICNLRYDNQDEKALLTNSELAYIKYKNRSATIFIHGYNVPYDSKNGNYGKQIIDVKIDSATIYNYKHISRATSTITNKRETILRNKKIMQAQFDELIPWPDGTDANLDIYGELNGCGAYNWFVNIEDNLNNTSDNYHHTDYSDYTRIVNITWSGDPKYCFDYMQSAREIVNAGEKLAKVLQQLLKQGIEINIIAHSLGCGVLLHAMNKMPSNSIKHAFLWEAAVPHDIFANNYQPSNKLWSFPAAKNAAKKISILYSKNDNILGPIPRKQHNQTAINRSKPTAELILAIFLTHLKLKGIYDLAMWVGVPASEIFNSKLQESIYQNWRQTHQDCSLEKTLDEQINRDIGYYTEDKILLARFEHAQNAINYELIQSKHYKIAALLILSESLEFISIGQVNDAINKIIINTIIAYPKVRRIRGLLTIMLQDTKFKPTPAMGYLGPINKEKLKNDPRFHLVRQDDWLWDHSGMKIPSQNMMDKVYKEQIINNTNGVDDFEKFK